jgi:hypothetical protein
MLNPEDEEMIYETKHTKQHCVAQEGSEWPQLNVEELSTYY